MERGRKKGLREEVRDVLLEIVRDKSAAATARASAARTLVELERDDDGRSEEREIESMTADEIDAEIAATKDKR